MRLRTANKRQRRKNYKKRRCSVHFRMGRCPTLWKWFPDYMNESWFNGYRYYGN